MLNNYLKRETHPGMEPVSILVKIYIVFFLLMKTVLVNNL